MTNVVVVTSLTLDGVMQAPGRPNKHPVLGFGTPSPRRRRPTWSGSKLVDSVTATGALVATTSRPEPTAGTSTEAEREQARRGHE
jgi:hypothetical protein